VTRSPVGAVLAWGRTLEAITTETSDAGVARLKLQWWGEEVRRAARGEARHPLAVELQPGIGRSAQSLGLCLELVQSLDQRMRVPGSEDLDELVERGRRSRGALLALATSEAGGGAAEARTARSLGAAVDLIRTIRDLGLELRRGRCPLPRRLLATHGLAAVPALDQATRAAMPAALREIGERARALHAATLGAIAVGPLPALAAPLALAEIHLELLAAIEEAGFRVTDQQIRLTPIRKLWKGLRGARRARRGIRRRTR
jgi:phytoene synthase